MYSSEKYTSKANGHSTSTSRRNPFAPRPFPIQKQTHSSSSQQKTQEELDANYEREQRLEQKLAKIPVNAPGTPPPEPPKSSPFPFVQLQARAFTGNTGQNVFLSQRIFHPINTRQQELFTSDLDNRFQQNRNALQTKSANQIAKKSNKVTKTAKFSPLSDIQPKIQLGENPHEITEQSTNSQPTEQKSQKTTEAQENAKVASASREKKERDIAPEKTPEVAEKEAKINPETEGSRSKEATTEEGKEQESTSKAKETQTLEPSGENTGSAGGEDRANGEVENRDKAPSSPEEDSAFQGVIGKAQGVATEKKKHEPAKGKSQEAQDAAESPEAELKGKAQDKQVGEMEGQPPGTFNAQKFKAQILERIKAITPTTEEEAQEFKKNNKINEIKEEVSSQVSEEKKNAASPIEDKAKEEPDTSSVEPKEVIPLSELNKDNPPGDIGGKQAAPKPKTEAEVSAPLQQNSQEIEQQMAEAEITDEQLEKSNEPQFLGALESKKQAQSHGQNAPETYRQQEQGILNQAEGEAQIVTQSGLEGMDGQKENILSQVLGKQEETKGQDQDKRREIGNNINSIYEGTKGKVEECLSDLDETVNSKFDEAGKTAKSKFEDYVGRKMDKYKEERYGEWYDVTGLGNRISDTFTGLPSEVNQFFIDGRKLYIEEMDIALTEIAQLVAEKLNEAKEKIREGKQEIQDYVRNLDDGLKQIGQEAAEKIQGKFEELEQSVDNKQNELVDSLVGKYQENLQAVDSRIEEMQQENRGLIDKAKDAIQGTWETLKNLKEMLTGVLKSAGEVVGKILKDPIGFLGNLISGVKQGFDNFLGNIMTHLQGGLIGWLTGAMGSMGIQIPQDLFSLKGIFSLVTQILGLSWNYVRTKAVKMLTEPVVTAMEKGSEIFQLLQKDGLEGVWEYIQEQFTDLKESVIGEIKNMVITQVITAGIKWVIGLLNPASAFVKAAMAIYDIVMFFVNRGSQIIELVKAVTESIKAIASGSVGAVAKAIEGALAKSVPVLIGFLASLLGISGLVGKVQNIIKKIRKRIDKAIDKLLLKAKKAAKKLLGKLGLGKKDKNNKKEKSESEKKHEKIGKAVAKELEKKPTKEMSYEDLRVFKEKQAKNLEIKSNKKLEKSIKMTIIFKSPKEDKKDGDIDFHIRIAPNNYDLDGSVDNVTNDDQRFDKLLYDALKKLGAAYYKGFSKEEIRNDTIRGATARGTISRGRNPRGSYSTEDTSERTQATDQNLLKQARNEREAQIQQKGNKIHQELAKAQIAYSTASQAEFYPNNTFRVGAGYFFVCQMNNYYIVPNSAAQGQYKYFLMAGSKYKDAENELTKYKKKLEKDKEKYERNETKVRKNITDQAKLAQKLKQIENQKTLVQEALKKTQIALGSGNPEIILNFMKEQINNGKISNLNLSSKAKVGVDRNLTRQYDYGRNPLEISEAQELYKTFPNNITHNKKHTIFIASVVAEPSRHSVAHITNMLLLDEKNKVPEDKKSENIYEHLPMTQGDSDPNPNASDKKPSDPNLDSGHTPKIVTDRDLAAVKNNNSELNQQLKLYFDSNKAQDDNDIVTEFANMIKKHLNLSE